MKLRLKIFKDKLSVLQKLQTTNMSIARSNKITKTISDKLSVLQNLHIQNMGFLKSKKTETISKKVEEIETEIPVFMTLSKLDWDNNEIHAGIIKDPTAKGGLRYQVIEPVLSERDKKAFEIIKKLLITELSVSLTEIKSKKDAEHRLKLKITSMIKKYRLKIPPKSIEKINYFAVRDFVHLGKIEPLMRDHMIEEISCDGTNIPI